MIRIRAFRHPALACLAVFLLLPMAQAAETYFEWAARLQIPDTRRGPNDDPAGDGVPNVLKYALALAPLVPAANLVPQAEVSNVQGAERLVLTVRKNPDAIGVEYIVEGSSDMTTWSSTGMIVATNTATTLTVADGTPITQANRRFLRLRVTLVDPIAGTLSWSQVAAIRGILDQAIAAYQIPGILYSVKVPGQEAFSDGRGVRDTTAREPITGAEKFRIGSASKTFVGMAALKLIQQRRLGFEYSISEFLPANVLSNYAKNLITIRMLLTHMSGINNYTNLEDEWFLPYILTRRRVWTNEELVELINAKYARPPHEGGKLSEPGQKWYYANTNTVLLAMIIEKITGMSIRQYITDNFITPLGLRDTIYPAPGEFSIPGEHAKGYVDWVNFTGEPSLPPGLVDVTEYDPTGVGPAGPMISTARDLNVWMEAIARDDRLIGDYRAGHIDWRYFTAFSNATSGPRPGSYGIKLAHEPDVTNNADYYIIGHRGQISGYDTAVMYLPEKAAAITVVCNRTLRFQAGYPDNALLVALNKIVALLYPDLIANNQMPSEMPRAALRLDEAAMQGGRPPKFVFPLSEYR